VALRARLKRELHALVAARLGDVDLTYRYFCDTAATDMEDTGVAIAAVGALWQAASSTSPCASKWQELRNEQAYRRLTV
jgi:trehalose/maltose hydrolase-like predicted phosphorylase